MLSGAAPNLTYTPVPNDNSPDRFTFRVNDGQVDSAPAVVSILVLPINDPPVAVIMASPLVFLTPGATDGVVISSNNSNAMVILDGSGSLDVDSDPLRYSWFDGALVAPWASDAVISNRFTLGSHEFRLVVNDGKATGTANVTVKVISPADAVAEVSRFLNDSTLAQIRKRPLLATLEAAVASFGKGDFTPALNQLAAFQNKVRAQVAPEDPALADSLAQAVQRITDALTNPPRAANPGIKLRLTSSARLPGSPLRLTLMGEPGRSYTVQVSTDLVHWTAWTNFIGIPGTNQLTDPAPNLNRRFYRAVTP
jgi:hypothetical protein